MSAIYIANRGFDGLVELHRAAHHSVPEPPENQEGRCYLLLRNVLFL